MLRKIVCFFSFLCEGLWDEFSLKDAARIVHKRKAQPAASELVSKAAKKAGKYRDDITVIVVDVTPDAATNWRDGQGAAVGAAARDEKGLVRWACDSKADCNAASAGGGVGQDMGARRDLDQSNGQMLLAKLVRAGAVYQAALMTASVTTNNQGW